MLWCEYTIFRGTNKALKTHKIILARLSASSLKIHADSRMFNEFLDNQASVILSVLSVLQGGPKVVIQYIA
jgi:hypothetical protein